MPSPPENDAGAQQGSLAATAMGFGAILLWSSLASLTTLTGPIPPFQLAALTFAIGTVTCLIAGIVTRQPVALAFRMPWGALALGLYGLLGYHAAYFLALKTAPPVEANAVNYLWPLLIVLFSALLPARLGGRPLRWWHIAGAAMGFAGTLIAIGAGGPRLDWSALGGGHAAAALAAVIWASYSVASRLYAAVPATGIIACCAATAAGALAIHLAVETTHWPLSRGEWLAVAVMGAGPVGIAFTLWDRAVKLGDLRLVGVASYATPLMSTALLAAFGLGRADTTLWFAVALVTAGALLAAWDTISRKPAE